MAIMERDGAARGAGSLDINRSIMRILRRILIALSLVAASFAFGAAPAAAATPAETLVADNIHKGLEILNNFQLTKDQRRAQFEQFLLGVTDLKRVAVFTLGAYGEKASQADRDAFAAAFQRYAVTVYQSYFARYSGETLKVTGSRNHAPGDDIVSTMVIDPHDQGGRPLEVDFRVRSDTGTPVIVDFSVAGVWLAPAERDQFTAYLGQHGGDLPGLIAYLDQLRARIAQST
jgi:phospholipid transport system substrate-binding protein